MIVRLIGHLRVFRDATPINLATQVFHWCNDGNLSSDPNPVLPGFDHLDIRKSGPYVLDLLQLVIQILTLNAEEQS